MPEGKPDSRVNEEMALLSIAKLPLGMVGALEKNMQICSPKIKISVCLT